MPVNAFAAIVAVLLFNEEPTKSEPEVATPEPVPVEVVYLTVIGLVVGFIRANAHSDHSINDIFGHGILFFGQI